MKSTYKGQIIKIIVLAVILALLLNPGIFPFAPDTLNAIKSELNVTFGAVSAGGNGFFSVAKIISAAAVVAAMWLACSIILLVLKLLRKNKNRSNTIIGLIESAVKYLLTLVTLVCALSILGVNIAGIFASLGILSLIIGFGAQSLIEDMVTGIFIIFEGNYSIGDYIILDDFRGVVRKMNIRTTTIEDDAGNLKIINNSDIRNIQNRSVNLSVITSDLGICYEQDLRELESKLIEALPGMYERHSDVFRTVPEYKGVQELADSSVVIRVACYVEERSFFAGKRVLNRELKLFMDDNGFEIPFPQLDVHQK